MKNRVIAITGQSGSGKSTVSNYYNEKGYKVIDCDEVAKSVHKNPECLKELAKEFGKDIIKNNSLEKSVLAKRAFENKESLDKLTKITHPFIIKNLLDLIREYQSCNNNIVFVDGAVIIGHDFEKYCDEFIVVFSDYKIQLERITKRDNIDFKKAENRIKNQTSYEIMLKKADYIIKNNTSVDDLIKDSQAVLEKIIAKM